MNFESPNLNRPKKEIFKDPTIVEKALSLAHQVFSTSNNPEDRWSVISRRLGVLLAVEGMEKVAQDLEAACQLEDEQEFVQTFMTAVQPLLVWQENDPRSFEVKLRENSAQANGFISLNEILNYGRNKSTVHIHLAPSSTLSTGEKLVLFKDGFEKLKEMLEQDEAIKEITATSWIVAANPALLERYGFHSEGEISLEARAKHFRDEKRPVHRAIASREDFLNAYKNIK